MVKTEIHERKKVKNYLLFAILLTIAVTVFTVSLIKLTAV